MTRSIVSNRAVLLKLSDRGVLLTGPQIDT